jgi:hypothetical protein
MEINGKVYKLVSPNTDRIYIGSTKQTLAQRINGHREKYKAWKSNLHHYTTAFDIFEAGNTTIELIELYPCENREALRIREQHHLEQNPEICVNKLKAYISAEDEKKHNEEIHHCECGGKYSNHHKNRHIETELHQNFLNGIKIKPYNRNEKIKCECGITYTLADAARHKRATTHQNHLAGIVPEKHDRLEPHECQCGGRFVWDNKARHERTKTHRQYLAGVGH